MRDVRVRYEREGASWWAGSTDLPGFTAVGASLDEVRQLAAEGIEFYLDGELFRLIEQLADGAFLTTAAFHVVVTGGGWTVSGSQLTGSAVAFGGPGPRVTHPEMQHA